MLRLGVCEKGVANSENEDILLVFNKSRKNKENGSESWKAGHATNSVSSENCKE